MGQTVAESSPAARERSNAAKNGRQAETFAEKTRRGRVFRKRNGVDERQRQGAFVEVSEPARSYTE
jgi:hypothetical protein